MVIMKKIWICFCAVLCLATARANYRTFVKEVNWSLSKASAMNSRNTVFKKTIDLKDSSSARFLFSQVRLGKGNYLKIESPLKKKPFFMNDKIIKGFGNGTPYLQGEKFRLSIVLKNKSRFGGLRISKIEANRRSKKRLRRSICGTDDRIDSDEKKMGRMMRDTKGNGGCTGGMISSTCLITAGHCMSTVEVVEFHVPASDSNGNPVPADPKNQYVKLETIDYVDGGLGKDWAVLRYKANPLTEKFPGEAQGFYGVSTDKLEAGDILRVTGYGIDNEKSKSQTQQTHTGELTKFTSRLSYTVDTEPGNSGTPVVLDSTNEIIGVHTHGGCRASSGSNSGTSLHFSERFQAAIKTCLAKEKADLRKRRRN